MLMAAYARRIVRFVDGRLDSDQPNTPLPLRPEYVGSQAGSHAGGPVGLGAVQEGA